MRKAARSRRIRTPVRLALSDGSTLLGLVVDGLAAMEANHIADHIDIEVRSAFADSLDIDEALRPGRDQENRWDYLLGHSASGKVVALEPHSAKRDQVATIIKKKEAAAGQLREHLEPGARVAAWFWVASGKVHFADTEKVRRRLDQHGIQFAGRRLLAKHLPAAPARVTSP